MKELKNKACDDKQKSEINLFCQLMSNTRNIYISFYTPFQLSNYQFELCTSSVIYQTYLMLSVSGLHI